MKFRPYFLALVVLLAAAAVQADERKEREIKQREQIRLHRELVGPKYAFQDYIADLKSAAESDKPKPGDSASEAETNQLAANRNREYKPLNPIVIEW
jgi:hypothetical protein